MPPKPPTSSPQDSPDPLVMHARREAAAMKRYGDILAKLVENGASAPLSMDHRGREAEFLAEREQRARARENPHRTAQIATELLPKLLGRPDSLNHSTFYLCLSRLPYHADISPQDTQQIVQALCQTVGLQNSASIKQVEEVPGNGEKPHLVVQPNALKNAAVRERMQTVLADARRLLQQHPQLPGDTSPGR